MNTPGVEALIQAAGQGMRLGQGAKAFLLLDGETLLERAVATMSAVAGHVIVAVAKSDVDRAKCLISSPQVSIIAGGERRSDTFRRLVAESTAPWLILHDIVHPFVSAEITHRVLTAAQLTGCAAAALPNVDFLYGIDGVIRAAPGEVMTVQKPIAFARDAITAGLRLVSDAESRGDPGVLEVLALAGVKATFVPGFSANYKITTIDDLTHARALSAFEKSAKT